ncbi:MAG: cell division protein SepF [Candidatus Bathyarchaeia archaeon]
MSSLGKSFGKIVRRRGKKSETSEEAEDQVPKIYLKAMPLRSLSDLDVIKNEVKSGNVLIIKASPLADKSIKDIKKAVNELCEFVKTVDGDIARLGEERIVVTPSGVRIWREKTVEPQEQVPTAA